MDIAIIGGGPAGLRAAEVAAEAGRQVTVFDARPSVGRKFLVAGVGGLNITNTEDFEAFTSRYQGTDFPAEFWKSILEQFPPDSLRNWSANLGIETFAASTGRIYPREMKAAPLLRRWIQKLRGLGVKFATRHYWTGIHSDSGMQIDFETPEGVRSYSTKTAILALGGGSWPGTGSDGKWVETLKDAGINIVPLSAANCGWEVAWPEAVMSRAEGLPLKNVTIQVGFEKEAGELLITKYGLEGGAIYKLGPILKKMEIPFLLIDFKPDTSVEQLIKKMESVKRDFLSEASRRWRLSEGAVAVLTSLHGEAVKASVESLAKIVKCCPLGLLHPRPIAEAISSAGGVAWSEINQDLMLKKMPGVFVAGEMIDWEAPTGGYLMQGCFATGTFAAKNALTWIRDNE